MKIHLQSKLRCDVKSLLIIPIFSHDSFENSAFWKQLSPDDHNIYIQIVKKRWQAEFKKSYFATFVHNLQPVLFVGLGDKKIWSQRKLITISRFIVQKTKELEFEKFIYDIDPLFNTLRLPLASVIELISQNIVMANYHFGRYKSTIEKKHLPLSSGIILCSNKKVTTMNSSVKNGEVIGKAVNIARDLVNERGSVLTPKCLAQEAQKMAHGTKIKVRVLNNDQMKKLGMNAIVAVGGASVHKPHFIIMEYNNTGKKTRPMVFVGKGVTFDTGGVQLKPASGYMIEKMHMDMGGAAGIMGAIFGISALKLKVHVVGLIPAAENAISGTAYRPGDIIRSMSGKTIGIQNTDAEGRVLLADALTYAERYKPEVVIDLATLTGGIMVALGLRMSGLFSKNDKLANTLLDLGEKTGDYLWRMPLWDEYLADVQGQDCDVMNLGKQPRYGQPIQGAAMLSFFTEKYTWAHIDMASRCEAIPEDHLAGDASGDGVRLFIAYARQHAA